MATTMGSLAMFLRTAALIATLALAPVYSRTVGELRYLAALACDGARHSHLPSIAGSLGDALGRAFRDARGQTVAVEERDPSPIQAQVHHDPPLYKGGGRNSRPIVLCPECHGVRHAAEK